jgi:hypothetical protein
MAFDARSPRQDSTDSVESPTTFSGHSNSESTVEVSNQSDLAQSVSPEQDTCQDKPSDKKKYTLSGSPFKYEHGRPLPPETADKAIAYIKVLTKDYPFQLRYYMALPYWNRFQENWCDYGDEERALRAI